MSQQSTLSNVDYFRTMFTAGLAETEFDSLSHKAVAKLPETDPDAFLCAGSTLKINGNTVLAVVDLSVLHLIKSLRDECLKMLADGLTTPANAVAVFSKLSVLSRQ